MQYASEKIEQAKAMIAENERRVLRQRRRVEKLLYDRQPADEAQAQLLIMEDSLLDLNRYLTTLVNDLNPADVRL
jgi:hypothetical protein